MATSFKCGVFTIPQGVAEFDVTGLTLGTTPTLVRVSVRQPASDADIIDASVAGTPTDAQFKVVLSAPCSSGYSLDWTAFFDDSAPGPSPVQSDSLAVDYTQLKAEVARFLGYDVSSLSEREAGEIDDYIQCGVRNFYYPPSVEGVNGNCDWSFLRQKVTVQMTAGTSDYLLPDGFGRVRGQIYYNDSDAARTVPVIPYGEIERMKASRPNESGRPSFAAILASSTFGSHGQQKRIYFFPKPDKSYSASFTGDADAGKLDATTHRFPLGGAAYSELVIESCLAIAEQKANDEFGVHTQKFNSLLAASVPRDICSYAESFGSVGDPEAWRW